MGGQAPIPGLGRNRRRIGRNRRALDAFVAHLRTIGTNPDTELVIVACRDTADRLDAADTDTDESRFTATRCATEHRANLMWLLALTATSSAAADPFALLAHELAELRDTPPT